MITSIYAALAGLILFFLSIRVIKLRREKRIAIAWNDDIEFKRAMRVHANFTEYVPLSLVLLFFLESQTSNTIWVHVLGCLLILGRVIHAYGVSQVKENFLFRQIGMVLTFTVLISASIRILFSHF